MGGQATFDLSPIAGGQATQAVPVGVFRYDPDGENPYTILPNVRCLRIDYREGPEPPLARFQYQTDDAFAITLGWPSQFEQLWPIDSKGQYNVLNDDRLVVMTQDPKGNDLVLFDGFAQIPQVDLSGQDQTVTFVAQGVAIRLWDTPITTRTQRDGSHMTDTTGGSDVEVALPCRWNPSDTAIGREGGYVGNSVPFGAKTELEDITYPVFCEPIIDERGEFDVATSYWYVSDALQYLVVLETSPNDEAGNPYVIYPTPATLSDILSCLAPPSDGPLNSADAVETDIKIRDYDASNKAVPDVMADLLSYCGFVMCYKTTTSSAGLPQTSLQILRKDALSTQAPKLLYLAASGPPTLDVAANNVTAIHLARDCNDVANEWTVETGLTQHEITVYLCPGFSPTVGDDGVSNITKWYASNINATTSQANRRMYRWYIADECADGHFNGSGFATGPPLDLQQIFPAAKDGTAQYVERYRPGSNTLISKDANGKPLKAMLEVAQPVLADHCYLGLPAINADGFLGTWYKVSRGWRLLEDRLGIEFTGEDPNDWQTGNKKFPHIRGVTWTCNGTADTFFTLRLTTVIESDQRLTGVTAKKRIASPTKFVKQRSADGKDHFQYCAIDRSSVHYKVQEGGGNGTDALIVRDDTKAALTHAQQLRSAHEFPTLAGSTMLPFITDYYQIGDRVKLVKGRNASMQINVGADQGESPSYPWVTAFAWDFQGDKQTTTIQFSDRRAEPQGV
jgi:hypothetical protein